MSVVTQLRTIQANAHAYYLQLHQIHWLVQGMRFKAMHEMTEGYYERMSELYDDAAERLLQKGAMPLLSIDELKAASTLPPLDATRFDEKLVLVYVDNMVKHLIESFSALAEAADEEGDRATAALADEQLEVLEKDEWMLLATRGEAKYE